MEKKFTVSSEHEAWIAEYNGHQIMVVNGLKTTLVIDGVEQDKKNGINTKVALLGKLPEGETVIVFIAGKFNSYEVHLVIGTEVDMQYGTINKNNEFKSGKPENKPDGDMAMLTSVLSSFD